MHKSRLGTLIIDCDTDDLSQQAEFWSRALGLATESADDPVNEKYLRLEGEPGDVQVLLQRVDHASRIHLDIETDDIDAEVGRLQALGARIVEVMERWTVMQAPGGHRFCVIGPVREGFEEKANTWA